MDNYSDVSLDKSCIYLNVFYRNKEINNIPVDILTDARNRYFLSRGKKIKDKVSFSANGIKYSFVYQIDSKGKLKWKTTSNGIVTEEVVAESAGYIIVYKTADGFVNKKMYFNHSHLWQKTEYFEVGMSEPVISLMPWLNDNKAAIAMYDNTVSFPQILYALPFTDNKNVLDKAISVCQPEVCATVNNVTYYFGDDEVEEKWNKIVSPTGSQSYTQSDSVTEQRNYFDISALSVDTLFKNLADTSEVFGKDKITAVNSVQPQIIENTLNAESIIEDIAMEPINNSLPVLDKTVAIIQKKSFDSESNANSDKSVMISQREKGFYFGELDKNNNRSGYGRTQTSKGKTLYEGEYLNDMKNGFGVSYYKSGKIAYVGNHKDDHYEGFGIEFRATDGSITIADFSNNSKEFVSAKFDKNGKMIFAGNKFDNDSTGITINTETGEMFIAKHHNGEPLQNGTIIASDGTLIYNGDFKNGNKEGRGILFNTDGTIKYTGEFKRDVYSGEGTLKYDNGNIYTGEFSAGLPNGTGELKTESGTVIYTGQWKKGLYNGDGRLYNEDGSYSDGKFVNGTAKGKLVIYDENGMIKYNGVVINSKPDGSGICYQNGEKVYDGQLSEGVKSGTGRLYSNGECVYMGSFENDVFSGFGISYKNSKPDYCGMWANNLYNGAGLLQIDDSTSMAGSFINGVPDGRINIIKNNILVQECIYSNGECEYMREYSVDGSSVIYDGNIKDNKREGMGCTFTEYGEKLFEGIFKNGEPFKSMKVSSREIPKLEYVAKLKDTEYEQFRHSKEFVVEQPMMSGVYSGQLNNGVPDGKGTILYLDHRYTGCFKNGIACGKGVIYFGDGTVVSGTFMDKQLINTSPIKFANVVYNLIKE